MTQFTRSASGLALPAWTGNSGLVLPRSAIPDAKVHGKRAHDVVTAYLDAIPNPREMPTPVGYKILVAMFRPPETTQSGNLVIPAAAVDRERWSSQVGVVLALGPHCYKGAKFHIDGQPAAPFCCEGDWVITELNAGTRLEIKRHFDGSDVCDLRFINDDEVMAKTENPLTCFGEWSSVGNAA